MATPARCLCGISAWEIDGPVGPMVHCHCSMCRKAHGAPFATYAAVRSADFRWLLCGEHGRYESSPGFFREFCARCGSVVPGEPVGERTFVPCGAFESDPGSRPESHIFTASKAPWYPIPDGLPQFDGYSPTVDAPARSTRDPLPRQHPGSARGSCLCGGAAWELTGHLDLIVHCHCSRCRRSRSAAHHANLFASSEDVVWRKGAELRRSFSLPEAKNFRQTFCAICGSTVPGPGNRPRLGIPAAALDDDPVVKNRIHIFCGSKAHWFEIADALPAFVEGPGSESFR